MSCSVPYTPIVVASQSFVDQSANLATTTIYTPAEDGNYEVAIYATQNTSFEGDTITTLSWTDEYSSQSITAASTTTGMTFGYFTQTLHVPAGNAIQVTVEYQISTFPPGLTYDLFVTVTKK